MFVHSWCLPDGARWLRPLRPDLLAPDSRVSHMHCSPTSNQRHSISIRCKRARSSKKECTLIDSYKHPTIYTCCGWNQYSTRFYSNRHQSKCAYFLCENGKIHDRDTNVWSADAKNLKRFIVRYSGTVGLNFLLIKVQIENLLWTVWVYKRRALTMFSVDAFVVFIN
jgi:hypothetical protein